MVSYLPRQDDGAGQAGCKCGVRVPAEAGRVLPDEAEVVSGGEYVARFKVPDGWAVQAFTFALDCTPEQPRDGVPAQ